MASGQVSLAIFWGMKLMSGRQSNRKPREVGCWLSTFLRELVSMPKRHIGVFLIATALLVLLEVELTEGLASPPYSGGAGRDAVPVSRMDGMVVQSTTSVNPWRR